MRVLCSAALVVMLAAPAWAQNQAPSSEPGGAIDPITIRTHEEVVVTSSYEPFDGDRKIVDKKFLIVGAALNTAMLLDTWSTFSVMDRCPTCREANPYVAPFVKRGAAVTFTAGQAFDIGVMTLAGKMKSSKKPQIRRIWWVVPVALTTGHLIAYQHNNKLAR